MKNEYVPLSVTAYKEAFQELIDRYEKYGLLLCMRQLTYDFMAVNKNTKEVIVFDNIHSVKSFIEGIEYHARNIT